MNFEDWIEYLINQHPVEIDMGLSRVREVAKRLHLLERVDCKVITVAGTNGKGTTCAFLENILLKSNYSVGVYSSPHLLKFNERVRVNGSNVVDSKLIEAFEAIEVARKEITLTFFEYATLAGLYVFLKEKVDVILLEVGLGGRLDATNIIDADISVLTSIGLDHQEFLGNTRESERKKKIGICRTGKPAIIGEPDVPENVKAKLKDIAANTSFVNADFSSRKGTYNWSFYGVRTITDIPEPQLPLQNAVTAIQTILLFDNTISDNTIRDGIRDACLAGRMEQVSSNPSVYLDVAHNPQSACYLKSQLERFKGKKIFALCGMLKDKDIQTVLTELSESMSSWHLVTLDVKRGATSEEMQQNLNSQKDVHCFCSVEEAWDDLKQKISSNDVVIVFGSFYTVSDFKRLSL